MKQKREQAMALLKRYKPKGIIARYKEASKAEKDGKQAYRACYNACKKKHCQDLEQKLEKATKTILTEGRRSIIEDYPYRQARAEFQKCMASNCCTYRNCENKPVCEKERNAYQKAGGKRVLLGHALLFGVELGVISVVAGVAGVVGYLSDRATEPTEPKWVESEYFKEFPTKK